ncbi:endonuclease domain-containing protein [Bifidobacterium saguinibicoloris]|uniref:endonuclease domain-containing protein n=1 Tax=Bifidobacterium saguinibicoloris TaxID=2834433 RepID=UPI001F28B74C|nr:endonuclease domain-containing protein [Bifidobacterium saguinibicoloris]
MNTVDAAASMQESLAQRKREVTRLCVEEAMRLDRRLLFGMTTSLMLQQVPVPASFDLDPRMLHTVSSSERRRNRVRTPYAQAHVWKGVGDDAIVRINRHVYALDLFQTWAQMAVHVSLEDLIVLGDSVVEAKRLAAHDADAGDAHRSFVTLVDGMTQFNGIARCRLALPLIMPNVASPQESRGHLMLRRHGIPVMRTNYVVPDMRFESGAAMTLDMAWPEHRVAVEYDGDQHRVDKRQWRRDQAKRNPLRGRGWIILEANASTFADEASQAEFSFHVARALATRGAAFDFHVVAMPLERLSRLAARALR